MLNDKIYTIVPIDDLLDESGEEVKVSKSQISKTMSDNKSTAGNNIVILGNDGKIDKEIATYIDIKPYAEYVDEKGETTYYPATNEADGVSAIGIALQNDSNVSNIEESIADFNADKIKRI